MRRRPRLSDRLVAVERKPGRVGEQMPHVEPGGPAGSSRSTVPSSSATRIARPVRSFVTEAHGSWRRRGPRVATTPSARVDAGRGGAARPSRRWAAVPPRGAILGEWRERLVPSVSPLAPRSATPAPFATGGTSTSPERRRSASRRTIRTSRRSAASTSSSTRSASSARARARRPHARLPRRSCRLGGGRTRAR